MKNFLLPFIASSLLTLSVGCIASGQVHGSAQLEAPELVYVSPGVQVIADYDEPIFYSSSYYWRYDAGTWYRSSSHTSGWVRIQVLPVALRSIETPTAYIHFHGSARGNATPVVVQDRGNHDSAPMQKEERHEAKEEQKEERREVQQQQKEERKEEHNDRKDEHNDHKGGNKGGH